VAALATGRDERPPLRVPRTGTTEPSAREPLVLPELAVRADGPGASPPPRTLLGLLEACGRVARTASAALRYEVLVFVVVGGALVLREPRPRWRERVIAVPIVLYGGVLVLLVWSAGYVSRRHALPFLLPLVGLAAVGWERGGSTILDRRGLALGDRRRRARWIVGALVVTLVLAWGPRDLRLRRADRAAVRAAAEWLAVHHPDSGAVAAQKLRVAYLAGAPFVPLPSGRDGLLEAQLRQRRAHWIVIDEDKLGDHLGLAEGVGKWLEPVHRSEAGGRGALVLEIVERPAH
jgi:hypothetical protein